MGSDAKGGGNAVVWKHIGLHGHSVGTFTADPEAISWQSAMLTHNSVDDDVHTSRTIPADAITGAQWTVFGRSGHVRIQTTGSKGGGGEGNNIRHELRFDGFPPTDSDKLRDVFRKLYDVELNKHAMSSCGASFGNTDIQGRNLVFRQCILEDADEEGEEFEPRDGDEMMSMDLAEVSQCVLPGNNRNEIELQFHESDTVEAGTDQLVAIRFYIPPDPDNDPNDRDAPTSAELFQQRIMKMANIKNTTGDVIVEFDEAKGTFLTPRGRYTIELYDSFLRMRGNKYDYKIKYDDISRLFLLPKPDDVHMAFVISLDKPIRQGQQRYQHLVMQTNKEHAEVAVNLDEKTLQKEYDGDLQPIMHGSLSNLVAKTFKVIARKKVFIPGKFANANQQACVKCALRANEGHLYPLEKQFVFIHKPPVLIRFEEVDSVEFQRYAGGQGSTRNFDLCVTLKQAAGAAASTETGTKEYIFSGIDRSDYAGLYSFLSNKKIRIKNLQEGTGTALLGGHTNVGPLSGADAAAMQQAEMAEGMMEMGESSDDSDFEENAHDSESEDISDDGDEEDDDDDENLGSASDSDLEEARRKAGITKKKKSSSNEKKKEGKEASVPKKKDKGEKKKKRPPPSSDEDESDNDNKKKKKKSKKRPAESSPAKKTSTKKKKKKKKDPNAPKKALTSYMLFSTSKRSEIKKTNPDATFGEIAKLISVEYKKLTDEERKQWDEKAKVDKVRYDKEMEDYSAPEDEDSSDESGSDSDDGGKSKEKPPKKKPKKDPNAPKKPMTSFMFFSSAKRGEIKKNNPDASFGDMAKLVGAEFKKLNEEQKQKWIDMAKKDKERYDREMEHYVVPKGYEVSSSAGKGGDKKDGSKNKAKRDPNAPKKNMTSFMLYSNAIRPRLKEKNPNATFGEMAKIIGQKFKKLSDEDRKKWDEKAKADKVRFDRENDAYNAKKKKAAVAKQAAESESDNESDDDSGSGSGSSNDDDSSDEESD